jgi:hypothetical protein
MRTTVRLDEHLLAQAKRHAAESGRTLTAVIEEALRESLARRNVRTTSKPVRLKTVKGGGISTSPHCVLNRVRKLSELMSNPRGDATRGHDKCTGRGQI